MRPLETVAEINRKKYLVAPTWEQIESFISELGVKMYHFEKFYHISFNTLTQVKAGTRQLAAEHWHIVYERIKPAYGAGFLDEYTPKQHKKRINNALTNNLTHHTHKETDNHDRLITVI